MRVTDWKKETVAKKREACGEKKRFCSVVKIMHSFAWRSGDFTPAIRTFLSCLENGERFRQRSEREREMGGVPIAHVWPLLQIQYLPIPLLYPPCTLARSSDAIYVFRGFPGDSTLIPPIERGFIPSRFVSHIYTLLCIGRMPSAIKHIC